LCRSEGRQCSARRTAPRTRIAAAHPFDSALSSTEQPGQSAQRYTQSPQSSIPNISQAVKPRNRRVWKKAARSRHTLSAGTSPPGPNLRYGLRPTQDEPTVVANPVFPHPRTGRRTRRPLDFVRTDMATQVPASAKQPAPELGRGELLLTEIGLWLRRSLLRSSPATGT
jgi:hypothetical protein